MRTNAVLVTVLLCASASPAFAQEVVDQKQTEIDANAGTLAVGATEQRLAQIVSPGKAGRLSAVGVAVACQTGSFVLSIHDVKAGVPGSTVLATATFDAADLQDPFDFTELGFDQPACLAAGEAFAIVLEGTGSCEAGQGPVGDPYKAGAGWYAPLANGPGPWLPLPNREDLPFYTVVAPGCDDEPPEEPAPYASLAEADATLDDLVAQQALPPFAGLLLKAELVFVGGAWRNGYRAIALAGVARFEAGVDWLVATGRLDDDLGVKLIDPIGRFRSGVLRLGEPPVDDDLVCDEPPDSGFTVFRVGRNRPYATLHAAEAEADRLGVARAAYVLAPGTHTVGAFEVTRDTIVRGEGLALQHGIRGGFVVNGPHLLRLERVTVTAPTTAPAHEVTDACAAGDPRGAGVWLDDQCATAELTDVWITSGLYGVYQRMGRSRLDNVLLYNAATDPLELGSGTGLLACSGDVRLTGARFVSNGAAGIIANGDDTHLWASDLEIRNTRVHPAQIELVRTSDTFRGIGLGALYVGGGADAEISGFRIQDNAAFGLYAHGDGTDVTLHGGQIARTAAVPESIVDMGPYEGSRGLHGWSVVARSYASVEITSFNLVGLTSPRTLGGVFLGDDAGVDLHDGWIRDHSLGVAMCVLGYDIGRLTDGVRYDNDFNLDPCGGPLPLPPSPEF